MVRSRITSKNQVTLPREIREQLKVGPSDELIWEFREGKAVVSAANRRLHRHFGTIDVGPRDVVADVKEARRRRGMAGA